MSGRKVLQKEEAVIAEEIRSGQKGAKENTEAQCGWTGVNIVAPDI